MFNFIDVELQMGTLVIVHAINEPSWLDKISLDKKESLMYILWHFSD